MGKQSYGITFVGSGFRCTDCSGPTTTFSSAGSVCTNAPCQTPTCLSKRILLMDGYFCAGKSKAGTPGSGKNPSKRAECNNEKTVKYAVAYMEVPFPDISKFCPVKTEV